MSTSERTRVLAQFGQVAWHSPPAPRPDLCQRTCPNRTIPPVLSELVTPQGGGAPGPDGGVDILATGGTLGLGEDRKS